MSSPGAVDWQAASGVGANDGYCELYVDGALLEALTGEGSTRDDAGIKDGILEAIVNAVEVDGNNVVLHLPKPYPPLMGILAYTAASILSVWRDRPGDEGIFINILPTGAGVLFYTTSLMVVNASGIGHSALGLAGVGVATGLLGIAALRAKGPITPPKGINTFAFPAA